MEAKDLIGLDFDNNKDFLECLRIVYEQNPRVYFELPGGNSLIVLRQQLAQLTAKMKEKGLRFATVDVVSAGDPKVKDITAKVRGEHISGRYFRERRR